MTIRIKAADTSDIPALTSLMREFYAEAGYPLRDDAAHDAFAVFIRDPDLGCVWLANTDAGPVGYVMLTLSFSMEYGGLRGWIDDFYVRPAARGQGTGTALLSRVKQSCRGLGVRALLVETGRPDHPAQRLYERLGFAQNDRVLLSQAFAPPIHEL